MWNAVEKRTVNLNSLGGPTLEELIAESTQPEIVTAPTANPETGRFILSQKFTGIDLSDLFWLNGFEAKADSVTGTINEYNVEAFSSGWVYVYTEDLEKIGGLKGALDKFTAETPYSGFGERQYSSTEGITHVYVIDSTFMISDQHGKDEMVLKYTAKPGFNIVSGKYKVSYGAETWTRNDDPKIYHNDFTIYSKSIGSTSSGDLDVIGGTNTISAWTQSGAMYPPSYSGSSGVSRNSLKMTFYLAGRESDVNYQETALSILEFDKIKVQHDRKIQDFPVGRRFLLKVTEYKCYPLQGDIAKVTIIQEQETVVKTGASNSEVTFVSDETQAKTVSATDATGSTSLTLPEGTYVFVVESASFTWVFLLLGIAFFGWWWLKKRG